MKPVVCFCALLLIVTYIAIKINIYFKSKSENYGIETQILKWKSENPLTLANIF